jgi:hypothetical protein
MDDVVAPLPVPLPVHKMVLPAGGFATVKVVAPQLLSTLITGVAGNALGEDAPVPTALVQPFNVCVTV